MKKKSSIQVLKEIAQRDFELFSTDKEKENIKNLKETFNREIQLTYGCDNCNGNIRKEGYCKECTIWQISPDIEESVELSRPFGKVSFITREGKFIFRTTREELDITILKVYSNFLYRKSNFDEWKGTWEYFHSEFPGIIFIPKDIGNSTKNYYDPMWEVSDIHTLLNRFYLYRQVPSAITNHRKHGKYYEGKNIYRKLELIK